MIKWFYPNEIPTQKSYDFKIFSIEVLIYHTIQKTHSVGWYNFRDEKWEILTHEKHRKKFIWRFFQDEIDRDYKNSGKLKWFYPSDIPDYININCEEESVEVLIYAYRKKYHTIGKFNYKINEWILTFNEELPKDFYWRYLEDKFDIS